MRRISRIAMFVVLAFFGVACNRPPAGFYEIKPNENVSYVTRGDQKLCMDIYQPANLKGARPAVLLFHGGGWVLGDRTDERNLARFLASMGYVGATAQYRLCGKEIHHPIPIQDALAALKFLRAHANDYSIDPDRIAIGGESAGGQMALVIGLCSDPSIFKDDSYPGVSTKVAAVLDIYGPTDLAPAYKSGSWAVKWFLDSYLCGPPEKNQELYREAAPMTYARKDGPPVLIVHGDRDDMLDFRQQAERLYHAIHDAGGPCELVRVHEAGHGWGLDFTGNDSMRTLPVITQFMARVFPEP
jgi:acetyl esterase/lipase